VAENRKVKTFPYQESNLKGERTISLITMVAMLVASALTIPRTDKAKACDSRLKEIKKFLEDSNQMPGSSDQDIKHFVQVAMDFFLLDDQLWKKD
jgi:hypothetical protein